MPSASSLFFAVLYFKKFSSGQLLGIGRKFTGSFIGQIKTGAKRVTQGAAHRPGAACGRGLGSTHGWDPPLAVVPPLGPFNAYKIPLTLETSGR